MGWLLLLPAEGTAQQVLSLDQLQERGRRAGIDPALLEQVTTRAQVQGISSDETARLLEPAVQLAEKDLPAQLILQKTLEGLAKNVPQRRIEPVLRQIHGHTEQVGNFIEGWMSRSDVQEMLGTNENSFSNFASEEKQELVVSAVQARMQGGSDNAARNLLVNLPEQTSQRPIRTQSIAAVLRILPDLPPGQSSGSGAQHLLTAVLDAGYEPEEIRQFPAAIRSAVEETNRSPEMLTRGAADQVVRGRPAEEVLGSLFNGNIPGGPPAHVGQGPPENAPPGQGRSPGEENGQRPPEAQGPPGDRGSEGKGPPEGRGPDGGSNDNDGRGPSGGGPPDNGDRGSSGSGQGGSR